MTELWEITQQNQWWNDPLLIETDPKITTFESSAAKWTPEAYKEIEFENPSIYVVKGVRQIGKSTLFKLLIRKLLKKGISPKSIFFFSFDNLKNYRQISELIKMYIDMVSAFNFERHYIFFDEVTMIKNWQLGIKYAADIGLLTNATLILSGSSAVDLKYSSEKLPGRRGGGNELNKLLLPISFHDFLKIRGIETKLLNIESVFNVDLNLDEFKTNMDVIQKNFGEYIKTGGIPAVLDNHLKNLPENEHILANTYSDAFFSTMGKLNRNRSTLIQIIKRIIQINFSRFGWQSFTSEIDIGSFHTTFEYLEHMADSYFIGLLYFLDHAKKVARPKKEKKLYITDPVFFKLFLDLSGMDLTSYLSRNEFIGLYIENIIYQHLLRLFREEAFEGLANLQNISFWYSKNQKEIDFLISDKKTTVPIEVRYQKQISPYDYVTLKKTFNKGIVLTRETFFADGNIVGIPAALFAACIK